MNCPERIRAKANAEVRSSLGKVAWVTNDACRYEDYTYSTEYAHPTRSSSHWVEGNTL